MASTPQRPPALTLACTFIAIASGLLLASLISVLSSWTSIETQSSIRSALDDAVLRDVGVTLDTAVRWARWALIALVPVAVGGLIFAVYAVRGHRASRWFLTVLCAFGSLVLLAGGLAGFLPAFMLLACAFTIWSADSRRWFDAVNGRGAAHASAASLAPTGTPQESTQPWPPVAPPAPSAPVSTAPPQTVPMHTVAAQPPLQRPADRRPNALTTAAWVAIGSSLIVVLGAALGLLVSTVGSEVYRDAAQQPGMARDLLRDVDVSIDTLLVYTRWATGVALVFGLLGVAAGAAALTGKRAGLVSLQVMAGLTFVLSLLSFPVGVPTGIAAVVVFVQSLRPEVRTWSRLS